MWAARNAIRRWRPAAMLSSCRCGRGERVAVVDYRPRALNYVAAFLLAHVRTIGGACDDTAQQHYQASARVPATTKRNQRRDLLRRRPREQQCPRDRGAVITTVLPARWADRSSSLVQWRS